MVVVGDGDDGTSFLLREGEGMVLVVGLEEEELVLMVAVVVLLLVRTVVRLGVGTAHNAESPSRRIAPWLRGALGACATSPLKLALWNPLKLAREKSRWNAAFTAV